MTASESTRGVLASLSDDLASAVQLAARSVVAVHGRQRLPASGLAWSADRVVTASYVLERDSDLSITIPDGTHHPARLVGRDVASDVAIVSVSDAVLRPIERVASGTLSAGHLVLAIGRPGTPEAIASFGTVSSVGGAWRTAQGGLLETYIRADIALLPGLSGGALVDLRGRVVAMLSAQLAGGDPVGIPVGSLDGIIQRILEGKALRRAYLGVSSQAVEIQAGLRASIGIQQAGGLMLLGIEPGTPAERGGLLPGDILLAIGDRTVEDGEALQMALGPDAIGRSSVIKLIRGGSLRDITLTPAPRPN
ncbi:MAG: S1C family serine protease [Chloroflexota bacterium]